MSRLRTLTADFRELKARVEGGGGPEKVRRQHDQGKLTARERVAGLFDRDRLWFEVGLLMAYDRYDGQAPAAGVVTGLGLIAGRPVVVVANDATVKAGACGGLRRSRRSSARRRLQCVNGSLSSTSWIPPV